MSTQDTIESVRKEFRADSKILIKNPDQHETLKIKFLGRKGLISNLFSQLGKIQAKDRPKYGNDLNNLKNDILSFFNENEKVSQSVSSESLDLSLPGQKFRIG